MLDKENQETEQIKQCIHMHYDLQLEDERYKLVSAQPGVQELQIWLVTAASEMPPGSQTTFLH